MDVSASDVKKAWKDILKGLDAGEALRLAKDAEAELGKRSTYYLGKRILGYKLLDDGFHKEFARRYDENFWGNQFHLHPRKHFKTTINTIIGSMRHALIDPNVSIAIMMNTERMYKKVINEMRSHYISTDKFRDMYPDHAVKFSRDEGTNMEFTTPGRINKAIRAPTFMGFSADTTIVSLHFTKIIFDDLVYDKNSTSRDLLDKTYENYSLSLAVTSLNKYGIPWHYICGTRWHFFDLYARILEDKEARENFHFFLTAAEWNEEDGSHHRLCPDLYSQKYLDSLRSTMSEYAYSCQFLNSPVPEGQSAMDPEKLRLYSSSDPLPLALNKCITVDPAASEENRKGDPTVIGAYSMDPDSNVRIIEIRRGWWTLDEICEQVIDCHKIHGIRDIGVEKVAFQKWLSFTLDRMKKERNLYINIKEIPRSAHVKKKGEHGCRLGRIIGYLNEGKIWVRDDEPELEYLKKELREYPFGRYDDIMDTITDAIELLTPPILPENQPPPFRIPPRRYGGRGKFGTGYGYYSD